MPRAYRLKERAQTEEETRLRIVEATVHLHQTVGDAQTTVSAIAKEAGVGRVTVYRHFPDERALLTGCTSHYFGQNPPPDPSFWADIADPAQRLETALHDLYAFYERDERMLARAEQDAPANPILAELLVPFSHLLRAMHFTLIPGWSSDDTNLTTLVGLALAFTTWQTLVRQQECSTLQAVDLMACTIRAGAFICQTPFATVPVSISAT